MFLQCLHQSGTRHPGSLPGAALLAIVAQGLPAGSHGIGSRGKGYRRARTA
jgi:hypothetical protein